MKARNKILFICRRNRLRSPTAERVFGDDPDLEVKSAGIDKAAVNPVTADMLSWADLIFVMDKKQRNHIYRRFEKTVKGKRIICLDIPDEYNFMDPGLVRLLKAKVARFLSYDPESSS
jgi:predicted protein tyrosine phosphatase